MTTNRIATIAGLALAASIALAGCATPAPAPSGMPGGMMGDGHGPMMTVPGVNQADLMFTMMMIPHHEQAIEMSDLVLENSGVDPRVTAMAQQIKDAQAPEIELMQGWLDEWGVGRDGMGNMGDMDHMGGAGGMGGTDGMGGMASDEEMAALAAADGPSASTLFLEHMITHHEGAIVMAQHQIDNGENADVTTLCESIVVSQTAEIEQMREILATL